MASLDFTNSWASNLANLQSSNPGTGSFSTSLPVQQYGYGSIPTEYQKYIDLTGGVPRMTAPIRNANGVQKPTLERLAAEAAFYKEYYPDSYFYGGADQDGGLGTMRWDLGALRAPDYPGAAAGSPGTNGTALPAGDTPLVKPAVTPPAPVQAPAAAVGAPGSQYVPTYGMDYIGDIPSGWGVGAGTNRGTGLAAAVNTTAPRW